MENPLRIEALEKTGIFFFILEKDKTRLEKA